MPPIALNHYGQVCLDASFNCQNLQKEFGKKTRNLSSISIGGNISDDGVIIAGRCSIVK